MNEATIRKARLLDVPAMHQLIAQAAKAAPVLPRSQVELYENLRDFSVCVTEERVAGCCALHIDWYDLAEVKSLAVHSDFRGKGYGRLLVERCLEEARDLQLSHVFALTALPGFFEKLGFHQVPKNELPQKIWGECVRCPKFPDCDEVAVLLETGVKLEADNLPPTLFPKT